MEDQAEERDARWISNPSSYPARLPAEGAGQMEPGKLSGTNLPAPPYCCPSLGQHLAGPVKPSHSLPPRHSPALSPLSFSLFLKLLLHRHHGKNQTGTGPIVRQRGKKKIIKKPGDLKKTRIISQIEWENLTCLITTENKHCANTQPSDWHAVVLNRRMTLSRNLPLCC